MFWFKGLTVIVKKKVIDTIIDTPEEPFVNSTTLLASELCLSSLEPAPFVAQLHRICLLPSHLPFFKKKKEGSTLM